MRPLLLAAMLAAALPACGRLPSLPALPSLPGTGAFAGTEAGGIRFRARVASDRAEPRRFAVTVTDARRGPALAAEAGRVEAVRYCLERYGAGGIGWAIAPEDAPTRPLGEGGTLSLLGTCTAR
jgi:hypothetical protein